MAEGMGDHTFRKERLLGAPRPSLYQSQATVRGPLPALPHLLILSQGHGIPLQARARALSRPCLKNHPAHSTRRDRDGALEPKHILLRPALQARRDPRCTNTPALQAPADIPEWRAGRATCVAAGAREHDHGIPYVSPHPHTERRGQSRRIYRTGRGAARAQNPPIGTGRSRIPKYRSGSSLCASIRHVTSTN